jgi:hypothetical protein
VKESRDGWFRIDKLDAYVPQSGAQRLGNIKTHLINTRSLECSSVWRIEAGEHKDTSYKHTFFSFLI